MRSCRVALVAALLVLGACSDGDEPTRARPAASISTPAADASPEPPLEASLLSAAEIERYVSSPSGIVDVTPEELGLTDSTDPRTPCGRRITLPPLDDTAVAAVAWSGPPQGGLFQIVWEVPERAAARLFDAFERDIRPGCPPYVSRTPTGTQRVSFVGEVDLEDPPGAYAAGAYLTIEVAVPGGQVVEAAAVGGIARRGGRLSLVASFSQDRLASVWITNVIEAAARQL